MSLVKKFIDSIPVVIIYILVFALPLFFTNLTTEFYDSAKFFLVLSAVFLILFIWGIRIFVHGKLELTKTPLDILLILYLAVVVLSTFLSASPYTSIYGMVPRLSSSLFFQVGLVLLYFLTVFNIRNEAHAKITTKILIVSASILSVATLLHYFKVPNIPDLSGNPLQTAVFLTILLPIVLSFWIQKIKEGRRPDNQPPEVYLYFLVSLLFVATVALIGNIATFIGAFLAVVLTLFYYRNIPEFKLVLYFSSIGLVLILLLATFTYSPYFRNISPLGNLANLKDDIQLPFDISWKISAGAFRDSPLIGSGPGTYVYNFTQYKPIEYNNTQFWNVRIPVAHSQFLQTWAEIGGLGIILLSLISAVFIIKAWKNIDKNGLGVAGLVFILMMVLSPMGILTQSIGFLIFALFMETSKDRDNSYEFSLSQTGSPHPIVPFLLFLPIAIGVSFGFYFLGKLALGEYYHRQALNAISKNQAIQAYNNLIKAEQTNPYIDLYRSDLAQTSFALANAIAAQKGPTVASPAGSLTEQDRKNIQQFLQQAIAEGRASVALSPRSANNWEVLALIYRQISGVAQNALQFSLDAYGRAIRLDPLNPLLRLAVGGVYYQAKNYDLAIRFFDDAVTLKPDHPNSYYNLAIALRDKGSLNEAMAVAQSLVTLLSERKESKDYQLASKLLEDIKSKTPSTSQPPAATPSAALEQKDLPEVLELPVPEEIATPPAVER